MKMLAAVAVTLLMANLAPPATAQAPLSVTMTAAWKTGTGTSDVETDVSPGDTRQVLAVTYENTGATALTALYAQLREPSIVTVVNSTTFPQKDSLAAGQKWTAFFVVDVSATAQVGETYTLRTQLNAAEGEVSLTTTLAIRGRADLELGSGTTVLTPDARTTLHLVVRNDGLGPAQGQTITFSSRELTIIAPTSTTSMYYLEPGQSQTFDVTVKAPDRVTTANITATMNYRGRSNEALRETDTIRFMIGGTAMSTLKVGLEETQVNVGRANDLHFVVTNAGAVDVAGISFAAKFGTGTTVAALNATDTQYIDRLGPGESAPVTVQAIASSAGTGIFSFTVSASGTNSDGAVSGTYNFAVALVGTIEFSLSNLRATVTSGANSASLSGTITNLGNTPAHNVYLSITGGSFGTTQQQYLGDIDANTAFPFTATTTIANSTTGFGGFGRNGTAPPGGQGGFPGGEPPAGFPSGAPPSGFPQGGPPQGGFPGNRTGRGPGGGPSVTITLTWNDDYGAVHTAPFNGTASISLAQAVTTNRQPTQASVGDQAIGVVKSPWTWVGIGALAAGGFAIRARVRRQKEF